MITNKVQTSRARGRSVIGKSDNAAGRLKSRRHRMSEAFIDALVEDFAQQGVAAIVAARRADPVPHLQVISGVMPKDLDLGDLKDRRLGVVMLPEKGSV